MLHDSCISWQTVGKYFYSAQDNKIIDKWVQSISSGGMCINDTIMQVAVENLPFGGVGKLSIDLTTFSN